MMRYRLFVAICACMVSCLAAEARSTTMVVTVRQSGDDVETIANGAINTNSLYRDYTNFSLFVYGGYVVAGGPRSYGKLVVGASPEIPPHGSPDDNVAPYQGAAENGTYMSGPRSFGAGGYVQATSGTGSIFGILGGDVISVPMVFLPNSYVANTDLSGTALFADTTIAALGLIPGVYTYEYGSQTREGVRSPVGTIELRIGQPDVGAVPEPATWAMMLCGFAMAGIVLRSRRERHFMEARSA